MNYTIINIIWKYFNSIEFYLEKKNLDNFKME